MNREGGRREGPQGGDSSSTMTRTCNKCGDDKPIGSFPKRYGRAAHLREHTCGACKTKAHRRRHPEKQALEGIRRRARKTGVRVEEYVPRSQRLPKVRPVRPGRCPVLLRNPKHDLVGRAAKAEASRNYYWRTLDKSREKVRDWRRRNPAKRSAQHYRERVRWATIGVDDLTEVQWLAIKAAYRYRCAYCGKRKALTQDHIVPVSHGGEHTASNIVPACQSCNSSKGARLPRVSYQPHLIA